MPRSFLKSPDNPLVWVPTVPFKKSLHKQDKQFPFPKGKSGIEEEKE
jgi:hypothetical protein